MVEAKDDGGEDMDAKAFDRRARANVSVRRPVVDGRVVGLHNIRGCPML